LYQPFRLDALFLDPLFLDPLFLDPLDRLSELAAYFGGQVMHDESHKPFNFPTVYSTPAVLRVSPFHPSQFVVVQLVGFFAAERLFLTLSIIYPLFFSRMPNKNAKSAKSADLAEQPTTKASACNFCSGNGTTESAVPSPVQAYSCNADHKYNVCGDCSNKFHKKMIASMKKKSTAVIHTVNKQELYCPPIAIFTMGGKSSSSRDNHQKNNKWRLHERWCLQCMKDANMMKSMGNSGVKKILFLNKCVAVFAALNELSRCLFNNAYALSFSLLPCDFVLFFAPPNSYGPLPSKY
jgi:hypothetical protein